MTTEEIRSKLKSGKTINDICTEYQITFGDLVHLMKNGYTQTVHDRHRQTRGRLYIEERDGKFHLRKAGVHYGTYRTLKDAQKVRDFFMFDRWDKRKIDTVCRLVGVERCRK